jgi:hypothetical protein
MRTDRQTDRYDKANSRFLHFSKAPKEDAAMCESPFTLANSHR